MKKKSSNKSFNRAAEFIITVGVGAILAAIAYGVMAFFWAAVAEFDTAAITNIAILSGIVFGLAVGYRLRYIIEK